MLSNFFLLIWAFLTYVRLNSLTIIILDLFLADKSVLWQVSTSSDPTVTSISENIDDAVISKSFISTVSGMTDNTELFPLQYHSTWLSFVSMKTNFSQIITFSMESDIVFLYTLNNYIF